MLRFCSLHRDQPRDQAPGHRHYADTGFFAATGPANCQPVPCVTLNYPVVYWAPAYGAVSFGDTITFAGTLFADKSDHSGLLYRRNRYYDPATGRFTQEDPIGLAGGLNVYGFANGDPVNFSDPFGLCGQATGGDSTKAKKVEVCQDTPDILVVGSVLHVIGEDHMWLRTESKEAGLGPVGGGVPGEGEYNIGDNSPYFTQTSVNDHSGRGDRAGSRCTPLPNVQSACANRMMNVGERRGLWTLGNTCRTFVFGVIQACSAPPVTAQRDMTAVRTQNP